MKNTVLCIIGIFLFAFTVFLAIGRMDYAMERDSFKEQIKLQRKEINTLSNLTSGVLALCKISVGDFESVANANGRPITWQGDVALYGPFKVVKKGECILTLSVVDGL